MSNGRLRVLEISQRISIVQPDLEQSQHDQAEGAGDIGPRIAADAGHIEGDHIWHRLTKVAEVEGHLMGNVDFLYVPAQTMHIDSRGAVHFGDFLRSVGSNGVVEGSGV